MSAVATLSSKGQKTRERILEVALELFQERGYEATTMRMIATAAGVSLGNSYYYFPTKEHLVQGFYNRIHMDLVAASKEQLAKARSLRERLRVVMRAQVDVMLPYHAVSGALFRSALTPGSPLSPFSEASGPARRKAINYLREVIDGSGSRFPADLAANLPELLWLYELGLVMFWVHDNSDGQRRTYELIEDSSDAIVRLLGMANLPGLRAIRKRMLTWVAAVIKENAGPLVLEGTSTAD
jgi:AcrR family transcriptional regulator